MVEYSWRFLHTNKYKNHVFIHFGNWNIKIENEHLENKVLHIKPFYSHATTILIYKNIEYISTINHF